MKKKNIDPLVLINSIEASFIGAHQVYTNGSCIRFYQILKTVFPEALPYWSEESRHMITRIGKKYYDISGEVECTPDYVHEVREWRSIPVAVAFPQKGERKYRFTTPKKL